jgi:hypothetical protein
MVFASLTPTSQPLACLQAFTPSRRLQRQSLRGMSDKAPHGLMCSVFIRAC